MQPGMHGRLVASQIRLRRRRTLNRIDERRLAGRRVAGKGGSESNASTDTTCLRYSVPSCRALEALLRDLVLPIAKGIITGSGLQYSPPKLSWIFE